MAMLRDKPTILTIDGVSAEVRRLFDALHGDYRFTYAGTLEQVLALAKASPQPDVILLDVMASGVDGYEVCLKLKASAETWTIPVLFVTASNGKGEEVRGLTVGAVDYIREPFQLDLVRARIFNHVELKRHKDGLEALVSSRTRELMLTQEATLLAIASLAETRDPETGGHIQRTQRYVRLLAERLRRHPRFAAELTDEAIDLLYKSAPLHDVGKVGIPDSVLLKPGKLTAAEFAIIKHHTVAGWNVLNSATRHIGASSFLRVAGQIALTHHERWDGSGYPHGLKGEAIPLVGRLMAVADVFDALISRRVYKASFPHQAAVEIMARERGAHFDPDILDCFVAHQDEFRSITLEMEDYVI